MLLKTIDRRKKIFVSLVPILTKPAFTQRHIIMPNSVRLGIEDISTRNEIFENIDKSNCMQKRWILNSFSRNRTALDFIPFNCRSKLVNDYWRWLDRRTANTVDIWGYFTYSELSPKLFEKRAWLRKWFYENKVSFPEKSKEKLLDQILLECQEIGFRIIYGDYGKNLSDSELQQVVRAAISDYRFELLTGNKKQFLRLEPLLWHMREQFFMLKENNLEEVRELLPRV